jgi:NTP pyrophosphatase (non-canonical NTP hydrolase)
MQAETLEDDRDVTDDGSSHLPASYGGLRTLQEEFLAYQRSSFPDREPRFFALELCGEAGELANLEKKEWKGTPAPDADYADEAADVLIAVLNYANERGIDLAGAVSGKMAEIDRRRLSNPGR